MKKSLGRAGIIGLLAFVSLCALPLAAAAAQPPAAAPAQAATSSKLGDLGASRTIVADVLTLVDKADFSAAKTRMNEPRSRAAGYPTLFRIKDLETLWDRSETKLKPKSPAEWHSIDRATDKALSDLRQRKPNQTACHDSLTALLKLFNT